MPDELLNGLRVLDLTDEKGFLCGKILADLGADVIKIERPGGDPGRTIPPFYHDVPGPDNSLYWFAYNTNKRSITLNLETARGQDIFKRLASTADIVIESFYPGYMDKYGIGFQALTEIKTNIIMTSITPFGQDGPYSSFIASDLIIDAMGVMSNQLGDYDRAPVRIGVPQAYMLGGASAAEGTMVALYYRGISGEGQHVDVSLMESVLWTVTIGSVTAWNASRKIIKRSGNLYALAGHLTPNIWRCKDGYITFLILGGLMGARTNKALTKWMEEEGVAPPFMKERDWDNWDGFKASKEEIVALIDAIEPFFMSHTRNELHDMAIQKGIMLYKVSDISDIANSEQLKAREFWINIDDEILKDTISSPGPFAKLSLTPLNRWRRPPAFGEDNNAIYKGDLAFSDQELDQLKLNGVV